MVPGKKICKFLQLPDTGEDEIYYLERVRYANETPVAHIKCYIPYKFVKNIETFDFSKTTLYRTLEDYYRLDIFKAYEVIEATSLDRRNAKLLGLTVGAPVYPGWVLICRKNRACQYQYCPYHFSCIDWIFG